MNEFVLGGADVPIVACDCLMVKNMQTRLPRIVKIFELAFLLADYAPYHRCTSTCVLASRHGYSPAIWTVTTTGERRWIGNTCSRISLGPSIRNYCCATSTW